MINKLRGYTLTVLFSGLGLPQQSHAATMAPPLSTQVQEVAQWFTGSFSNAQQVAGNPSVPFITMSNCPVQLNGDNPADETQRIYIYLQQQSTVFNRVAFYSFSQGDTAVELSVRSFLAPSVLSGICNQPESERIINVNNLAATSCNLNLIGEPLRYTGTNAPVGCPTSSGGRVVSTVAIQPNKIDALDQIFSANGNLLVATPIEYRRTTSVPEPSLSFGLLAFGIWSAGKARSSNLKQLSRQEKK